MTFLEPSLTLEKAKEAVKNGDGNTLPIFVSIPSDMLTPVTAYLKVSENSKYSFLLESVTGTGDVSRYSMIGTNPRKILKTGPDQEAKGDPLLHIENELKKTKYINVQDYKLSSITGGAFGYIGYDCVQYFEPKTACDLEDSMNIPESIFMFCDEIVLFDNRYKIVKVYGHLRIPEGYNKDTDESLLEQLYNECVGRIYKITATLNSDRIPTPRQDKIQLGGEYKSNTGREGYKSMVQKLKEHIVKGDIYQSVPSQRITRASNLHPFNIYRYLRTVNPSPYMFYYDFEDFQVVGASPELLARVNRRRVDNHPIAGTRKRGSDAEEDEKLAAELISDEKERAEHVMLVDLSRNDLNRVCKPNSMSIDKEMEVEYFSHVMHIVSNVSGELRDDKTCFDAIRSVLPAGTLSGSPKVRAVQLIYECEKEKRGIYGGAVGHFQYNGNMDTCIAIRTMVVKNNMVYLQSGAGVVYDSDPEAEWQETLNKAMSNLYTLSSAEEYYKKLEGQRQ